MIVIIDYKMGNLHSVLKAFRRLRINATISSKHSEIQNAEKLIIPGVGNFKQGMQNIREMDLQELLNYKVIEQKTPILGICLGMQLFTQHSEEGDVAGLGWFDAVTVRFKFNNDHSNLRIPHIGWNNVNVVTTNPVFSGIDENAPFYCVHSYHVICKNKNDIAAETSYGIPFVSAIHKNNIFGVQFHPEKSHDDGLLILKNFAEKV